ncbi:hypothetical protein BJ992_000723 [Sphaerisporangium rubeum]|uniref:Uncharacterized protein n=1 Tax=Sphaerisporangium rubeum TaxID=321317 RepID=A0A7X0I9U4_9ACTN|nr:hypothetical protein [Sphaerisporangium rubeum]
MSLCASRRAIDCCRRRSRLASRSRSRVRIRRAPASAGRRTGQAWGRVRLAELSPTCERRPWDGTPPPVRRTGLPSVHLYSSARVKPATTRLPRLVARGYPAGVHGHSVRVFFLRPIHPDVNPLHRNLCRLLHHGSPHHPPADTTDLRRRLARIAWRQPTPPEAFSRRPQSQLIPDLDPASLGHGGPTRRDQDPPVTPVDPPECAEPSPPQPGSRPCSRSWGRRRRPGRAWS